MAAASPPAWFPFPERNALTSSDQAAFREQCGLSEVRAYWVSELPTVRLYRYFDEPLRAPDFRFTLPSFELQGEADAGATYVLRWGLNHPGPRGNGAVLPYSIPGEGLLCEAARLHCSASKGRRMLQVHPESESVLLSTFHGERIFGVPPPAAPSDAPAKDASADKDADGKAKRKRGAPGKGVGHTAAAIMGGAASDTGEVWLQVLVLPAGNQPEVMAMKETFYSPWVVWFAVAAHAKVNKGAAAILKPFPGQAGPSIVKVPRLASAPAQLIASGTVPAAASPSRSRLPEEIEDSSESI